MKRIGYVDSLKGLSMLMVVAGHIIIFCALLIEKVIATSRLFSFVLLGRRFASVSKNN